MAISGGDGSIILTTKVDESGLKKGMQQANKFAQMSTNEQRRMAQSLSKVYRQQGMSQSEAQKKAWQDLKNNTVATKDLAKATEDVAKKTEQATKETKEYGETAKRSGTIAKNTFLAVGKAFLTIGVASAAAVVAMTKQAVSAYADYEQLVGGVETLFKGSAQKVMDYANDAFYTAGVSANEYMKQVTSFSASLIRSTAGDTDKATDIANMALIDISDNVNKMGSSMESVTLAYQGFAKQQYMLLDNLKLGYGGTKTEMERLLKDAQALTGVKYDINNLADVYSAIHAIQEELGITGTTAKEAEKTITGSANMMKAAWQNVLSAIAGGGDLDRAINNLVYSIQKYFENIVPVVERSLAGIGRLIEQVAPLLVQNVATALIKAIPSLINAIYLMIIGLASGIWQGIKALFTGGSDSITAETKTSVGGIATEAENASTGMEKLGDATEKAGKQAKKSLAAFDDLQILSAGGSDGNLGDVLADFQVDTEGGLLDSILGEGDKLTAQISEMADKITPQVQAVLTAISVVAGTLSLAVGLILVCSGVGIPQGLGLIAAGALSLASAVALNWNWLGDTIRGVIEKASSSVLFGAGLLVMGILMLFLNPALGFGLIVAGVASLGYQAISPHWNYISEKLKKLWGDIKKIWDEDVAPKLEEVKKSWDELYDKHLKPIADFMSSEFAEDFKDGFDNAIIVIRLFLKFALPALSRFLDGLSWVLEFVDNVFSGEWGDAWQQIVDVFEGKFKKLKGVIKPILNSLIDEFNRLIERINSVSFSLPSWIPNVGGNTFSLDVPKIPRLAQGAVIPPNREFLAVLGDNKRENEIVSPVSAMKQAFMEAMVEMGGAGQTTKEEHYYLDETELMSIVYKLFKGGERINGNSLISGGAY